MRSETRAKLRHALTVVSARLWEASETTDNERQRDAYIEAGMAIDRALYELAGLGSHALTTAELAACGVALTALDMTEVTR